MSKKSNRSESRALPPAGAARAMQGDPPPTSPSGDAELARALHRLQVHEVEIELQNEALRDTQAALKATVTDFTDLYDYAPVGYFTLAASGVIQRLNLVGARLLGGSRESLIGRRFIESVASADRAPFDGFLTAVLAGGSEPSCEVTVVRAGQAPAAIRLTGCRSSAESDCRLAAMDITAHRKLELAAHETSEYLERIFRLSPDFIVLGRNDGHFTCINPAFEKVLGLDLEELEARQYIDFVHPDDQESARWVAAELAAGRDLLEFSNRWRCRDGSYLWLEWRATSCAGGYCALARNVTNRIQELAALRQTREALQRENAELEQEILERTTQLQERTLQLRALASELTLAEERERRRIAHVIHDQLQQMLVSALMGLRILQARFSAAEDREAFRSIERILVDAVQAARSLTTELSDDVLRRDGLAAALRWLSTWCLGKFGQEVTVEAEDQIDPTEDEGVVLFLCVRELLFNVAKHAGVNVAAVRMWRSRPDSRLKIEVSDQGVGFVPDQAGITERFTGGFGLINIRERLEMLGGGLEIESSPGGGSRCTVWMPVRSASPIPPKAGPRLPTEPPAFPAPWVAASAREGPKPLSGSLSSTLRLVVADDHAEMRETVIRLLQAEAGFTVVGQAANGHEALQLARQLRPHFVVMDWNMPQMDGLETTAAIQRDLPDVKVLGLSILAEPEYRIAMIRAGAVDLISKDLYATLLVPMLRAHSGLCG